jgi:hypothetical protein
MPRLSTSTSAATQVLGAGATSQTFYAADGAFTITFGGTFETSTATLSCCNRKDGTFKTLVVDNTAGTPTDQTFTVAHVSGATKFYSRLYALPGLYFQVTTNSTGTPPVITVDVNGVKGSVVEFIAASGA